MTLTDPIGDMFTRLRNGISAQQKTVDIPASRLKEKILALLLAEGYISGYELIGQTAKKIIRVGLKYVRGQSVLTHIQRASRPGCRVYFRRDQIFPVRDGFGCAIISTSQGIITDRQARKMKIGGEVLGIIW